MSNFYYIKPTKGDIRPAYGIAKSLGIKAKIVSRDFINSATGITLYMDGKFYIAIANDLSIKEKRITFTHELAHIFLGHLLSHELYNVPLNQREFEAEALGFILYNFLYGIDGGIKTKYI